MERADTELTAVLERLATRQVPGISAAVVDGGAIRECSGAGSADLSRRAPAAADTVYLWFSMTKIVTATAASSTGCGCSAPRASRRCRRCTPPVASSTSVSAGSGAGPTGQAPGSGSTSAAASSPHAAVVDLARMRAEIGVSVALGPAQFAGGIWWLPLNRSPGS